MRAGGINRNKIRGAVLGHITGDALGVPAEFRSREELRHTPVTDMKGFGTHHQPAGTWSDDSSMVLATMEWFSETNTDVSDYSALMEKFGNWLLYGDYTPHGEVFDCGVSTSRAIMNYGKGMEPLQCGGKTEWENGNGSLMRILPAAIWYQEHLRSMDPAVVNTIYNLSSLTHGHMRSKIGCLLYAKIIADLLADTVVDKLKALETSLHSCKRLLDASNDVGIFAEEKYYHRLWNLNYFQELKEEQIKSSGYVVDTLEAAIWCFLNTENYKDCVLKAVNMGDDTDTVAAVAGGLAGAFYGAKAIPKEWIEILPRLEWIEELIGHMIKKKEKLECTIKENET